MISQLRYIHTYKVISYIQFYASRSWGPTLPPHAAAGGAGAAAVQCSAGEIRAEEVLCIQKLLVMIND